MAVEQSVESEYFSNPTKEQVDSLKSAIERNGDTVKNEDEDIVDGGERETSTSGSILEPEKEESIITEPTEKQEEKTISWTDTNNNEVHNYTQREWEDEWNKNKVENQWQNLGRDREDMYDQYTGLDYYGKDASKEMSSIGVPKSTYLTGIRQTDENGNYKYQEKLNAVNKARGEYTQKNLSKAANGARALYDKAIGKAIDKVSAYRNDISEKARETSDKRNEAYTNDAKTLAESNLGMNKPERKVVLEYDAAKLPDTSASYKPEVKMKVDGIEKPLSLIHI